MKKYSIESKPASSKWRNAGNIMPVVMPYAHKLISPSRSVVSTIRTSSINHPNGTYTAANDLV